MSNIQALMDSLVAEGISAEEAIQRIKGGAPATTVAPAPQPAAAPVQQQSIAEMSLPMDDWYYKSDELVRKPFEVSITGNLVNGISPSAEWSEKLNMMLVFNLDDGQMLRLQAGDDSVYQDLKTGKTLANMFAGGVAWPDEFLTHCYPSYADKFQNMRTTIKLVFFVEALRTMKVDATAA